MTHENFAPRRSLRTQALAIAAAVGVGQAVVAILYLAAARASNVDEFGSVVAAVAAGIASFGLLDFGTNALWAREIPAGRLSPEEYARRAMWKLLYILCAAVLWAVTISTVLPESPFWISGLVTFAQASAQTLQTGLRASGRSELVAVSVIMDKGTSALVFVLAWQVGFDVLVAFVICLIVGPVMSGIMSNWLLLGAWKIRFSRGRPLNPWRGARNYGIANAADTARSYDVTLTALCGGTTAAGTYGAVNRWTQAIELLTFAFTSAAAPYVANAPSARAAVRHLRSAIWLPLLAILASCVMIVLAPWMVEILLGDQYAGSADVLRVLAVGTIASNLNQPIFVLLMARGKDRDGAALRTAGVAIMLTLVAVLTPRYGAVGAAIAYAAGQFVLLLMFVVAAARLLARDKADESIPSAA